MSDGPGSVRITRKVGFCAAHRYHNPAWSEERNREVFGACNNPHGHGHNYELEVTVSGKVAPETGMVLNLRTIDRILQEEVVRSLDHRFLDKEIDVFRTVIPTTENLAVYVWELIRPALEREGVRLHCVRLFEAPDLYAEYLGEVVPGADEDGTP